MKYLKSFKQKWDFRQKCKEIHKICEHYYIINYTINKDLSIDVDGDIRIDHIYGAGILRLTWSDEPTVGMELPLKFNVVTGRFNCSSSGLTTLKGSPRHVGGEFYCMNNQLSNFEGCPDVVDSFYCLRNNINSFKGCENLKINRNFDCDDNEITSFEGFPKVYGYFSCLNNPIDILWRIISGNSLKTNNIDLFNDYDIIQNDKIIISRLSDFLKEIGNPIKIQEIITRINTEGKYKCEI